MRTMHQSEYQFGKGNPFAPGLVMIVLAFFVLAAMILMGYDVAGMAKANQPRGLSSFTQ